MVQHVIVVISQLYIQINDNLGTKPLRSLHIGGARRCRYKRRVAHFPLPIRFQQLRRQNDADISHGAPPSAPLADRLC